METKPLRLWDRSRATTDWHCERKRYYAYEHRGVGITGGHTSLELFLGLCLHDAMAAIAALTRDGAEVNIDDLADQARTQVITHLMEANQGEPSATTFAQEQAALTEGLIRGFHRVVWPRIMEQTARIRLIEGELLYEHDGLGFMSKPDLVIETLDGELIYHEWKSTSSKKDSWFNSWNTAVQLHSTIRAIETQLKEKVHGVVIGGLYKGYCLEPSTPVLTSKLEWKPVGKLQVEDKLAAFEEYPQAMRSGARRLRHWKEASVVSTGRAQLPCYELYLEDGTKFVCSENHRWLTAKKLEGTGAAKWTETKDLKVNKHRIYKVIEPWEGTGEIEPYDAGYLSAAFDGEGNLWVPKFNREGIQYNSLGLGFTQNTNAMYEYMTSTLTKYGIKWSGGRRTERKINTIHIHGKSRVLSLMGKIQPKRLLAKLNINNIGMLSDPETRPVKVVEKRFVGLREVVTLETSTGTLIANGFASHNSSKYKEAYQNSPFCYGFLKAAVPPFIPEQVSYEYKYGLKRTPTWEMPGGVKQWVESMPIETLGEQFPCTPTIYINDGLIDAFFRQRAVREKEIAAAMEHLRDADLSTEESKALLDAHFPQRFDQCTPPWGKGCEFRSICHGNVEEPLEQGWLPRQPHHSTELDQMEAE